MHFVRTIFLNDPDDVRWLNETHLKLLPPLVFESFVLSGNNDSPERLDLYAMRKPEYNTRPVLVLVRDGITGELVKAAT